MPAFVTGSGKYLPGPAVSNDEIEDYIGSVSRRSSRLRERTLTNCGIKTRYYGIDKKQESQETNTGMVVKAIQEALANSRITEDDVELIACGTTFPDLLAPGLASMVHGELGTPPCEVISAAGICAAAMVALKAAAAQVASGEKANAVVSGSEFVSRLMKSSRFDDDKVADSKKIDMEAAFLRYMLSDGAAALTLQDKAADHGLSLRIDWITLTSFANTGNKCMYFGAESGDSAMTAWDYPSASDASRAGALTLRQNLALLPNLVRHGVDEYQRLLNEDRFDPEKVAWLPWHYSSEAMKTMIFKEFAQRGLRAPDERKMFSNLTSVGNVGSASMFLILDELLRSEKLAADNQILCMVPESGRFSISFMHMTAVGGTT